MKRQFLSLIFIASALAAMPVLPSYSQSTQEITRGNCKACADACHETINYCTKKGGALSEANVTNALKDCATACKMTSEYLARGSELQGKAASLCIQACNSAAKACDQFPKDTRMQGCANETRKCASNLAKVAQSKSGPL